MEEDSLVAEGNRILEEALGGMASEVVREVVTETVEKGVVEVNGGISAKEAVADANGGLSVADEDHSKLSLNAAVVPVVVDAD